MKKSLTLFPLVLVGVCGCCTVDRLNNLVNESTNSIYCNIQSVTESTAAIRENARLVDESTKTLEDNKRLIEAAH